MYPYRQGEKVVAYGYANSDFGGDLDKRKWSTSGYAFSLGSKAPIQWRSKKQEEVAQSSCEAKYRALLEAAKEVQWIQGMTEELGFEQFMPTKIFCNNQNAIKMTRNHVLQAQTKHIECHLVREYVEKGQIEVE